MKKLNILFLGALLAAACQMSPKQLNTQLFNAAEKGDIAKIEQALAQGADVNYSCSEECKGWTPVMIAAAENHPEAVKLLLEKGANPNAQNRYGRSALHFAVNYSLEPIVDLLLQYKADPKLATYQNFDPNEHEPATPIEAALRAVSSKKDNIPAYNILKKLIYLTDEVNIEYDHTTPLMVAFMYDDDNMVKYLLEHGANPYHVIPKSDDKDNITAYFELDDLIMTDGNPASSQAKALFRPLNATKKTEKALLLEKGAPLLETLRQEADNYLAKNGELPKQADWVKAADITLPDGKWDEFYLQYQTPDFSLMQMCEPKGCSLLLSRTADHSMLYTLSATKTANNPDNWHYICSPKTWLGTNLCFSLSANGVIKNLEVDEFPQK